MVHVRSLARALREGSPALLAFFYFPSLLAIVGVGIVTRDGQVTAAVVTAWAVACRALRRHGSEDPP